MSSLSSLKLLVALTLVIIHLPCANGTSRNPEDVRPGRHEDVDRFDEVYAIVRNTFLLAAAPAVISFLISVFRDPDLPLLIRAIGKVMKKRLLGSLSS